MRAEAAARSVAACALTALLAAGPARAEVSGRSVLSYQGVDGLTRSSDAFHQLHELRLDRQLSIPLRYQLWLKYEDDRGASTLQSQRSETSMRQLQPSLELSYLLPAVQVQTGYTLVHTRTLLPAENTRDLQRLF